MVIASFISGLAFFAMGLAVALYRRKGTEFRFADYLYLLAGFGLLQGLSQWLDVFSQVGPFAGTRAIVLARAFTLPVSSICLVQFGARTISASRRGFGWLRPVAPILWILWLAAFLVGPRNLPMWDLWSHYLLCMPGAVLAGWALAMQMPGVREASSRGIAAGLGIAAVSFLGYAAATVLLVDGAAARAVSFLNFDSPLPVLMCLEAFRVLCGLLTAYGVIRLLGVFSRETQDEIGRLHADCARLHDDCLRYEADITRLRQVAAFGEMSEEMARQVEELVGLARIFMQRLLVGLKQRAPAGTLRSHVREAISQLNCADGAIEQFRSAAGLQPPSRNVVSTEVEPAAIVDLPDDRRDDVPGPDRPLTV